MSDDVLDREEVEDIAFVKLNGDLGRPPTNAARRLLAHDAAMRETMDRLAEAAREAVERNTAAGAASIACSCQACKSLRRLGGVLEDIDG